MASFATAIIDTTQATALLGEITGALSDNVGPVLVILGAVVGLRYAVRMVNGAASKGKLRF